MKSFFSQKNIIGLLLLITALAAFCCLWVFYLPRPEGGWQEKEIEIKDIGRCILSRGHFSVLDENGEKKWSSEKDHKVQDFLVSDLDGDGEKELILLLWKVGKYGSHRPFWVTEDEKSFSQHIFIYSVSSDCQVREKWCASDVGCEILRFKLMEKNDSIILTEDVEGRSSLWRWQSFGLRIMDNGAKIVAFGDNIIHKEIYEYALNRNGRNFDYLYEPFYEEIRGADIAEFQQETMLVDKEAAISGYPMFGSPIEVGEAIVKAGFNVACCAGNHALDKGIYGINITSDFYKKNGVTCLGVQNGEEKTYRPFEIVDKNGISFALLDYTFGTGEMDVSEKYPYAVHYLPIDSTGDRKVQENDPWSVDSIRSDIRAARDAADFVIVFVHWGNEYEKEVSDYQRSIARVFAEGGADLVIGTHPHVVQEVEMIERPDGGQMLVYYSLGNFRAHQGFGEDTKIGGEALITVEHCFEGVRIADYEIKEIDAYVR